MKCQCVTLPVPHPEKVCKPKLLFSKCAQSVFDIIVLKTIGDKSPFSSLVGRPRDGGFPLTEFNFGMFLPWFSAVP